MPPALPCALLLGTSRWPKCAMPVRSPTPAALSEVGDDKSPEELWTFGYESGCQSGKQFLVHNVPIHGRCGKRRSPRVQPSTIPVIEPGTFWLVVRDFTTSHTPPGGGTHKVTLTRTYVCLFIYFTFSNNFSHTKSIVKPLLLIHYEHGRRILELQLLSTDYNGTLI